MYAIHLIIISVYFTQAATGFLRSVHLITSTCHVQESEKLHANHDHQSHFHYNVDAILVIINTSIVKLTKMHYYDVSLVKPTILYIHRVQLSKQANS